MWRDHDAGRLLPLLDYLRRGKAADQRRIVEEYLALPQEDHPAESVPLPATVDNAVHREVACPDPGLRQQRIRLGRQVVEALEPLRCRAAFAPLLECSETATGVRLKFPLVDAEPLRARLAAGTGWLCVEPVPDAATDSRVEEVGGDLGGVLQLIGRAVDCVDELHRVGVVHGAISVDTILIRPDHDELVLAECGYAMLASDRAPEPSIDVVGLGRLLQVLVASVAGPGRGWSRGERRLLRGLAQAGRQAETGSRRLQSLDAFSHAIATVRAASGSARDRMGWWSWLRGRWPWA